MVCASGIGVYGDRGDEPVTEESATSADGFLADVVRAWEAAAQPARDAGIRVVHTRFGIVQSARGGALRRSCRCSSWASAGPSAEGAST